MAELIDQVENGDGTITNYYDDGSSDVTGTPNDTSGGGGGGDGGGGGGGSSTSTGANFDTTGWKDNGDGTWTKTYDDGSTQTVDNNANTINATDANNNVVTTTDSNGNVVVTNAGKVNPSSAISQLLDKIGTSNFLKNAFTTTDAKGNVVASAAAPAIGAIIGMLNRQTGEEGTRGLKTAPEAKPASRQQITIPQGPATGQGQQYFSPMDYAGGSAQQPTTTTGGGIAGLNTGTAKPANYVNPNAQPVTSLSGNAGTQTPASSQDINKLLSMYNQYNPQPTQEPVQAADGGMMSLYEENTPVEMYAQGGISTLGSYTHAAGGRMLKGPGDGMSDDIPASIAGKQPARLATDEFVIPADVVSHLGNGSSDAGAKVLYDMMAKVRKARTGNSKQGKKINPQKFMPR